MTRYFGKHVSFEVWDAPTFSLADEPLWLCIDIEANSMYFDVKVPLEFQPSGESGEKGKCYKLSEPLDNEKLARLIKDDFVLKLAEDIFEGAKLIDGWLVLSYKGQIADQKLKNYIYWKVQHPAAGRQGM